MARFIEVTLGRAGSTLIEIADPVETIESEEEVYRGGESSSWDTVVRRLDLSMDKLIQEQIVGHCKLLVDAFEQLKKETLSPKRANVEFGLQFNAEGNIYLAKVGGEASFRVSFEWEL